MKKILFLSLLCLQAWSQGSIPLILSEKVRATVIDEILEDRMTNLLPQLMRNEGIEMWVIISREYNEDPVMKTMLPATWLSARRRTIMVFYDNGKEVERLAIARYDVGKLLKGEWNLNTHPDQWDALVKVIREKKPKNIALNFSKHYGHADGLTFTEHTEFTEKLTDTEKAKIVSASKLAVNWLETRTEREIVLYNHISKISHQIVKEALSDKVIHPGITTTEDVVWYFRQRVTDLGLETWFHPTVDIQRKEEPVFSASSIFSLKEKKNVIQPGDIIHCDFGITYLRLNTDHQQLAYVLKPGEKEIPLFLQNALKQGNKLQDILVRNFKEGLSGNEILDNALREAKNEGLNGIIYTHPIGSHGHAAGPTIGMWDNQGKTVGAGDHPLLYNTAYSIELTAVVDVAEWGKPVRIMLEENGVYRKTGFEYIDGRQERFMLISVN